MPCAESACFEFLLNSLTIDIHYRLHLLPAKFFNMLPGLSAKIPLVGPTESIPGTFKNTRDGLLTATGEFVLDYTSFILTWRIDAAQDCIELAQYLGLEPLPGNPTVQAQKNQIASYLGVVL